MSKEREALKLALEALESSRIFVTSREKIKHPEGTDWYDERITAIKEAVEEPKQKPVVVSHSIEIECQKCGATEHGSLSFTQSPPQRTWQGLTDEELEIASWTDGSFGAGARWAEAKLKEKNT